MSVSKGVMTFTRNFSHSPLMCAAMTKMIKPPIAVFGFEGRYATALFSAAMKEKKIDNVEKELKDLKGLMKTDKALAEFMTNPLLKPHIKIAALKKAFVKKNYSPITLNFLEALSENGRLKSIVSIIDCFIGVMGNVRGEIPCEIISAKPLDAPTLAEFEKTLKGFVKKNEKILLQTKVDPSLIGGVIINIGDKYINMSISSKIKAYNSVLREIV